VIFSFMYEDARDSDTLRAELMEDYIDFFMSGSSNITNTSLGNIKNMFE
jgi:hypothetical protein